MGFSTGGQPLRNIHPMPSQQAIIPEPVKKKQDLHRIEHVEYRGTPYIVQHLLEDGEDQFIVIRDAEDEKKGKVLSPNSVAYKAIVKAYRGDFC
jgi:hypothetical protein